MALVVLKNRKEIIERVQEVVQDNKQTITEWLKQTPYYKLVMPQKGTVSFLQLPSGVDSTRFAIDLLNETGIFFVPGSTFEMEGYVRLGLAKKHQNLKETLTLLDSFTKKWMKEHLD